MKKLLIGLLMIGATSAYADVCHIEITTSVGVEQLSKSVGDNTAKSTKKCLDLAVQALIDGSNKVKVDLSRGDQGHKTFILQEVAE